MQMTCDDTSLRHGALVYESEDEYVAFAVPFLKEGLEAGEGAIVAHTKEGLAVMREALGQHADHVMFVDVSSAYTRPGRALARYHAVFRDQLGQTPSLRAVADVRFGLDPGEWDLCTEYEAVFNRSFAHLPAWIFCSYDANETPDPVIDGVWRTHPEVVARDTWHKNDRYEDPDCLLRALTPEPKPLSGLRSIGFGTDLEEFRERLASELAADRVAEARTLDVLLAATELAANAIEHGGGVEDVRVGRTNGRFVCEIVDRGSGFDEPAAGYLAPQPGVGRGLWVARLLAWRIEFFSATDGFTARVWL